MNVAVSLTIYGVGSSCSLCLTDLPSRHFNNKTRCAGD